MLSGTYNRIIVNLNKCVNITLNVFCIVYFRWHTAIKKKIKKISKGEKNSGSEKETGFITVD